jgi:hypothetical protein
LQEIGKWGAKENAKQQAAIERAMKVIGDVPDMDRFKELGVYD